MPKTHKTEREQSRMQAIKVTMQAHGFLVIRLNSGKAFTATGGAIQLCPEGTPDLLALPPDASGIGWWIETKTEAYDLTPMQRLMHEELQERGQRVYTWRTIDDALAALREAGLCRVTEEL